MKFIGILLLPTLALAGCLPQDPRAPLDEARREIDTIQANQQQAVPLFLLQQELQRAFLADPHIQTASVGFYFGSQECRPYSARLVVKVIILMEVKEPSPAEQPAIPASQPATASSQPGEPPTVTIQDIVRNLLSQCGWDVESLEEYHYEKYCRVQGEIRGSNKPPTAGSGLDILPELRP